jgi:hypothetical protein
MIKYLYVLVSNEDDNYLEQAFLSITSLKMHMPDAFVSLLTDDTTHLSLIDKRSHILKLVDEVKVMEIDSKFKKKARSRWLKTSMRRHIEGDFIFIDCDTVICDNLDDIKEFPIDLGAVLNAHTLLGDQYNKENIKYYDRILQFNSSSLSETYFNSGVILCRDIPLCHTFFDKWHNNWQKGASILLNDQPSFNQVNVYLGNILREMNGIWNCQIRTGGTAFLSNAKIIHYFATNNSDDNPFILASPSLLQKLKISGVINDDILQYMKNPKTSFYLHTQLLSNKNIIEIIHSRLFKIFSFIYFLKSTQLFIKLLKKLSYFDNKYFNKNRYTKTNE